MLAHYLTVKILVLLTDDGSEAGSGPLPFLKDHALSTLPDHPRGLLWKYFATVGEADRLLDDDRAAILAAIGDDEPFIAHRLLRRAK